ncbi:TetR/AcrR family transcriptional regulator [Pelomonas sp. Root1444]|uniref:TetR/AcrR family transcriptional regulator n=1 Tax=Pelomonas sp. Root1444 TaxID=1736464 RepID=UPI0007027196|nr:TetR/AcrR family transcriptional regulator [Pelomonas sp. Root1444]KQY80878.1 hypothetical protein ASD35_03250 [Pelomonas sp. Root1444]
MPLPEPDRRISRTQCALQQALLTLTERKDYEAITVEELCESANVGRSTFYEHFRGKDDLKRSGVRVLAARLKDMPLSYELAFSFSLPLLGHAKAHLRHIRALGRGRGREVSLQALTGVVHDQVERELLATRALPAAELELATRFFAGAFMAVLVGWLDEGARLPAEEVDAAFRRLASGIRTTGQP